MVYFIEQDKNLFVVGNENSESYIYDDESLFSLYQKTLSALNLVFIQLNDLNISTKKYDAEFKKGLNGFEIVLQNGKTASTQLNENSYLVRFYDYDSKDLNLIEQSIIDNFVSQINNIIEYYFQ